MGSPPLVRERLFYNQNELAMSRITPARAGKTGCSLLPGIWPRDHPRSCGKDRLFAIAWYLATGSPPLVRERQAQALADKLNARITPARAGKTFSRQSKPPVF